MSSDPKGVKKNDPIHSGVEQCTLRYKNEPAKAQACKQYVMHCGVHAGKPYVDEFKLCSEKKCLEIEDPNQCYGTAVFLAGQIEKWGPPGKPMLKKKDPPKPEPKPDTIHRAGDDAYEKLGLDRSKYTIYYADGGEDIAFVDRIGVEKEPGFSTKHPDDRMRRISLGKEGKPLDSKDKDVAALLAKWRIPTVDNIDIEKLIAFSESFGKNAASIKKAIDEESYETEQVARDYIEITDAAREVYLAAAMLDSSATLDFSWNGPIAKEIMTSLGDNAYLLPLYVADVLAEKGKVDLMEEAVAKLRSMGDVIPAENIAAIRQKGYSAAVKKALKGLEAEVRDGKAAATALQAGTKYLDTLLAGRATAKAPKDPVFTRAEDVVFEDTVVIDGSNKVSVDGAKKRIDSLRIAACVIKAREFLDDARKGKLQGKLLEGKFKDIRGLPTLMGVTDLDSGLKAVEKEIADFIAGNSAVKVREYIGKARTEYELFNGSNTDQIEERKKLTTDPKWLKTIDGWLNVAIEEASGGGIIADVQAEIHQLRRDVYETYTKAWADRLNTMTAEASTASSEAWYNEAKKSIAYVQKALTEAALKKADGASDEETKASLSARIDGVAKDIHIARVEQLIRFAITEKEGNAKLTQPNWGGFLGIIDEAWAVINDNGISDEGLTSKLSQLKASINAYDLETSFARAKQMVDGLDVSRYDTMNIPNVGTNNDLANVDLELDAVMAAAKRADAEAEYAPRVKDLRRRAYEKYFTNHNFKSIHALGTTVSAGSFDTTMMQIRLAEMYLNAQRGEEDIFDPTFKAQKTKELDERKRQAHRGEAERIETRAKELFVSEAVIRRNAGYLKQLNSTLDEARAHMKDATDSENGVNQIETTRKEGYIRYIVILIRKVDEEMGERAKGWDERALGYLTEGIAILTTDKISGTEELVFKTIPVADLKGHAEKVKTYLDLLNDMKAKIEKDVDVDLGADQQSK